MKSKLLAAFVAFASFSFAGQPGSYALVTSSLVLTTGVDAPATTLPNGNKQTVASLVTLKVTNAAILAEAQTQGLIPAGSLEGWKIYAIFGTSDLRGFVASNGLKTVWIYDVIDVTRYSDISGFAAKGKWVKNTEGDLVSGGSTYTDGFKVSVNLGGVVYHSTCAPTITDKIVTFGTLSEPVWRPGAFRINVVGLAETPDDGPREGILSGGLTIAAAKANYNLSLSLLGFPGYNE